MRDILEKKDNFITYRNIKSNLLWGNTTLCKSPKVSIIMPVYNHPDYFRLALKSAIEQNYVDQYEIIVVDNNDQCEGPTANQKIVEEFNNPKVLYYRNEKNIGMFGNWNRGIELARAPYVTYCHDDDMLLPNALTRLMEIQKRTGNKAIFSAYNTMDSNNKIINSSQFSSTKKWGILVHRDCYTYTLFNQFISSCGFGVGCLFSKQCLIEIGGYDPEFYPAADYALQAHYTYRFGSVYNCIPTFNYRIAENESLNAYHLFCEADKHFRKCMRKELCLPNFILDRIIEANYNISKVNQAIRWGKKKKTDFSRRRISDKIILTLCNKILQLNHYSF